MIRGGLLTAFLASSAMAADMTVQVDGGVPNTGQLLVSLFTSETDWMRSPARETTVPLDAEGAATFIFHDLSPGVYGLSIIYDEDGDGELDLNLFGIPTEAFGFSNNARALLGPPDWSEASFSLQEVGRNLRVHLDRAD